MKETNDPAALPPENRSLISLATTPRDLAAGLVVFLVALPLCLGIAIASDAPPMAGVIAGIVGGLVVGAISGSHTSVSGPAAGLFAIVAVQIGKLGTFEAFLLAVIFAGVLQIGLGIARAGSISGFFPSSVIKGLLAAIGVLLILKQFPHVLGHDDDPEGDMAFVQHDEKNTFTEIGDVIVEFSRIVTGQVGIGDSSVHAGAIVVGLVSVVFLVLWNRTKFLKNSILPGPLFVVIGGVVIHLLFQRLGGIWAIGPDHLVDIPVAESFSGFWGLLPRPDFSAWNNPQVYFAGVTIAIVASLETLLNLEAVDTLDPEKRKSPASRELLAQG